MIHYLAMVPLIVLHLLVFLSLGMLVERLAGESIHLPYCLVTGYLVWFALFEPVTLAATFLRLPTHVLGRITAGAGALVIVAGLYAGRESLRGFFSFSRQFADGHAVREGEDGKGIGRGSLWLLLLVLIIVAAECIVAALYTDGSQDAVQYVGSASTAAFTDGLFTHSPDMGRRLKSFDPRYVFFNYPMFSAAVSSFFHSAVIIHFRIMMPVVNVIAANLIWHKTATELFGGKKRGYADLTLILTGLFSLCSASMYQQGAFFFTRIYEGKAVISNICAVAVIWCSLRLYTNIEDRFAWFMLSVNSMAALCFSGSGYLIILSSAAFAALPVLRAEKKVTALIRLFLTLLPAAAIMAVYFLSTKGVIPLKITW